MLIFHFSPLGILFSSSLRIVEYMKAILADRIIERRWVVLQRIHEQVFRFFSHLLPACWCYGFWEWFPYIIMFDRQGHWVLSVICSERSIKNSIFHLEDVSLKDFTDFFQDHSCWHMLHLRYLQNHLKKLIPHHAPKCPRSCPHTVLLSFL